MPARCLLLPLLSLLASSPLLRAQEPRRFAVEELRRQLASDDARQRAWGAYRCAEQREQALVPELRRRLAALAEGKAPRVPGDERDRETLAVLDALIQTRAKLSAKELAPFVSYVDLAVILASRDGKEHAGLLLPMVEAGRGGSAWVAACNVMLTAAPEMLAPALLPFVEVELRVVVRSLGWRGGGRSFTSRCGRPTSAPDGAGFPPMPLYVLRVARRGEHMVANGPEPVSFTRGTTSRPPALAGGAAGGRSEYALKCLRELAGMGPYEHELHGEVEEELEWRGPDTLRDEVAAVRDRLDAEFEALLEQLVQRKLLSKQRAGREALRIRLDVRDRRQEQQVEPLPDLQDLVARPR